MTYNTPFSEVPGINTSLADPFLALDNTPGLNEVNNQGELLSASSYGGGGLMSSTSGDAFDFRPVSALGTYPDFMGGGPGGGGTRVIGAPNYMPGAGGGGSAGGLSSGQWGGVDSSVSGGGAGNYLLPNGQPAYTGTGQAFGKWDAEQMGNAQAIVKAGKDVGASPRDIQIALMAAMTESTLHNYNYGDRDSVGLFQQRSAWGDGRTDPYQSAKMFFTGGAGGQRGLFDIPNRDQMGLGEAAQAVQVSAYPDRYAAYQHDARQVFHAANAQGTVTTDHARQGIIDTAKKLLGVPYVWGGTSWNGVDCSGLVQLVYKQFGINLPRVSYQQAAAGPQVPLDQLKPGDLVAWDNSSRNPGADHIAIYLGNGQVIQAPHPGASVEIAPIYDANQAWGVSMQQYFPQHAPPPPAPPVRPSRSGDRTSTIPSGSYSTTPRSGYAYDGGHTAPEPERSGGTYTPPPPVHSTPKPPEHGSHTQHSDGHAGGHEAPT